MLRNFARRMSIASPEAVQQYRAAGEDRMLKHLAKVAESAYAKGNLTSSRELYSSLVMARRQRHGDNNMLTISAIGKLSVVERKDGEHEAAIGLAREAVDGSEKLLGALHPDSLRWQTNLAKALVAGGELAEAQAAARDAVEGYHMIYGAGHADAISAENILAAAENSVGRALNAAAQLARLYALCAAAQQA